MTAVEHQLRGGHAHRERKESGRTDAPRCAAPLLAERNYRQQRARRADRRHQQEHPAPTQPFPDQPAEHRSEDRPHHAAYPPQHQDQRMHVTRKYREEDPLPERHQRGAEDALQDTRHQQRLQGTRETAQRR